MDIQQLIENYQPFDEREEKDKTLILEYIDTYDNVLTRDNEVAHFTCSGFVINKSRDKLLLIYHNVYDSWAWAGGHADGEIDLLNVAKREVKEETGIKNIKPISEDVFIMDISTTLGHIRQEKYIEPHIHLDVAYLFEVDEDDELIISEHENSDVKWIPINEVMDKITEEYMRVVFSRGIKKIQQYNL